MAQSLPKSLPYVGVGLLGLGISWFLVFKNITDIEQIKVAYIADKTFETEFVATRVEDAFKAFYQGLRTMTLLPGVKNIDRYGKSFQIDSKKAMQQIYNNTFLNVTLSEVYILPKELNPDSLDPVTNKPEEPILTFDEFVATGVKEGGKAKEVGKLEEVEIHEYRLMRQQLAYFRSHFATRASFNDLNVPAISGEPVITCDNSEFTKADLDAGNNKPRMGIVYSLPVYDDEGQFHGAISGTVRLNILEKLLPKGTHALVSPGNKYIGKTAPLAELEASQKFFSLGQTNSDLIYSKIKKLNINDSVGWELWAVAPESEFSELNSLKQANLILKSGLAATLLLCFGLTLAIRNSQRNQAVLEHKVKEKTKEISSRNRDMRLILDNAEQGFLTCSLDGHIGAEYSKIVEKWFGQPNSQTQIWGFLTVGQVSRLGFFKSGWEQLVEGFLPFEAAAGQMPSMVKNNKLFYSLDYTPIYISANVLTSVLVVVTDITAKVEAEHRDQQQRELVATFMALTKDRAGFIEFFADAESMIKTLTEKGSSANQQLQFRLIHTLKGNSSQYGLTTLAEICHQLESKLHDTGQCLESTDINNLSEIWQDMSTRLLNLIGDKKRKRIELDLAEYLAVLNRIKAGISHEEIMELIERWRLEPASKRLERLADQARSIAKRLNFAKIAVEINDHNVRLEPDSYAEVWSSMIHVIRNAIDHGFVGGTIENPKLTFEIQQDGQMIAVMVKDNGNGIDWQKVREKGHAMGLATKTHDDLVNCIFSDGLSTKDQVTDLSGRGVGMAAVKAAILECGGTISLRSEEGQGAEFTFRLPVIINSQTPPTVIGKAA